MDAPHGDNAAVRSNKVDKKDAILTQSTKHIDIQMHTRQQVKHVRIIISWGDKGNTYGN